MAEYVANSGTATVRPNHSHGVSLLEQPMSIFPFAPFLLATHILLLDWNENVVPKLLAIFRSV